MLSHTQYLQLRLLHYRGEEYDPDDEGDHLLACAAEVARD